MHRAKTSTGSALLGGLLLIVLTILALGIGRLRASPGDTIADRELGQPDMFHSNANTPDPEVFNQPNQIAVDRTVTPNHLYVADVQNSRVLGYSSVAALVTGAPADLVVGQRDIYSAGCNNPVRNRNSLCNPNGVAVDSAGNLFVADTNNLRVLEFKNPFAAMKATGMTSRFPAILVLGQPDFSSNLFISPPTAASLIAPVAVALDKNNNLYVADQSDNRVLEYNAPPTNGANAKRVFGQLGSFTSNTANNGGVTAKSLNSPKALAFDPINGSLYIADNGNSRVLRFSTPLTSQTASLVFGQAGDFTKMACNTNFTPDATSLCGASGTSLGVTVDHAENVYIADFGNHRVLEFNAKTITSKPKANLVLGQPDFSQGGCNQNSPPSAKTLCGPSGVVVDSSNKLWVSDLQNNRVLGFTPPSGNDPAAAVALGQPDATHNSPNSVDPFGLNNPAGIAVDKSNHLFVADYSNSRVLGYFNAASFANNGPADLVIGQTDFYSGACNQNGGITASTLCNPSGVAVDQSGYLYVVDYGNTRVLEYKPPFSSGVKPAFVVFGQAGDFTTHNSSTSRNGLSGPTGLALDNVGRLYVVDRFNNRVLQFVPPFPKNPSASLVIGQADFVSGSCNRGGPTGKATLCNSYGVAVDAAGNLYVADEGNSRVLEYSAPLTRGEGAALVFGQLGSFTASHCDDIGTNADSLCNPQGVGFDAAGNLYIADSNADNGHNNRVLEYNTPLKKTATPGSGDTTADRVFGQADDFTSNDCNFNGTKPSPVSLCNPYGVALDSFGNLYVSDYFNNRVLEYDVPVTP